MLSARLLRRPHLAAAVSRVQASLALRRAVSSLASSRRGRAVLVAADGEESECTVGAFAQAVAHHRTAAVAQLVAPPGAGTRGGQLRRGGRRRWLGGGTATADAGVDIAQVCRLGNSHGDAVVQRPAACQAGLAEAATTVVQRAPAAGDNYEAAVRGNCDLFRAAISAPVLLRLPGPRPRRVALRCGLLLIGRHVLLLFVILLVACSGSMESGQQVSRHRVIALLFQLRRSRACCCSDGVATPGVVGATRRTTMMRRAHTEASARTGAASSGGSRSSLEGHHHAGVLIRAAILLLLGTHQHRLQVRRARVGGAQPDSVALSAGASGRRVCAVLCRRDVVTRDSLLAWHTALYCREATGRQGAQARVSAEHGESVSPRRVHPACVSRACGPAFVGGALQGRGASQIRR